MTCQQPHDVEGFQLPTLVGDGRARRPLVGPQTFFVLSDGTCFIPNSFSFITFHETDGRNLLRIIVLFLYEDIHVYRVYYA